MSKIKQAAELAALLASEGAAQMPETAGTAHVVAADALALLRIGASVKRWAVRACNGEGHSERLPGDALGKFSWVWDDTDTAAHEKADARALAKASEIAARYGATVTIGGDPRGYVLRLVLASGRTNTLARDGWGVA